MYIGISHPNIFFMFDPYLHDDVYLCRTSLNSDEHFSQFNGFYTFDLYALEMKYGTTTIA